MPTKKKPRPIKRTAEMQELRAAIEELPSRFACYIPKPVEPPPPFVAMLVIARKLEDGAVITMGASGPVGQRLEVVPQYPLRDVQVIVFCDLERVDVRGIFCGVDLMQSALGSCPVAFCKLVQPGVRIVTHAERRS